MAWLEQFLAIERYWLSLMIYGFLMALATVIAPLTIAVTVPFMAKIFGPFAIFVVSWLGWMIGAGVVFYISRSWGRPLVERMFSMERIESLEQKMPTHLDFWVLLLLRTFIPVDVLSYAVGLLSTISFKKYLAATALGIVPFAFVLSYGPDALTGNNPWLLFSFLALVLVMLSSLAIFQLGQYWRPLIKIYTHDGKFHADDVFAVATLALVLEQQQRRFKIIRTRNSETLTRAHTQAGQGGEVFIVDVGGVYDPACNSFDHHQKEGAGTRANGIAYASFGLIWQTYGARLADNNGEVSRMVDEIFVQQIDGPDNGQVLHSLAEPWQVEPVTLHDIVEDYYQNAATTDAGTQASDFERAVGWAKTIIPRAIDRARRRVVQQKQAKQVYSHSTDRRIMISEDRIGKDYFVAFAEPLLVVSPRTDDLRGEWSVVVVPTDNHRKQGRITFPVSWHGLSGSDLQQASGISGAQFCHRAGDFLAVARSKKSALEMARQTLEYNQPK